MFGISGREAPADPLLGAMLNEKYQVIEFAGQGATGIVYKARQIFMDRMVAIKILKQKLVTDPLAMGRFERELKTLGKLKHASIVPVFDCFVYQGLPCCVMDFLSGRSIKDMLSDGETFEAEAVIQILLQVTDALKHAHNHGVIHRDLKSANIMIESTQLGAGRVYVVDFGLAKFVVEEQRLTQTGEISGSPVYMSPEQCAGADLDGRSDLYSLGIVMYEMLSGQLPFLGQTVMQTLTMQVSETPEPLSSRFPELKVPEKLEAVVLKCLEKDPDDRFQTMAELHGVLDHCLKLGSANAPRLKENTEKPGEQPPKKPASPPTKKANKSAGIGVGPGSKFEHRAKIPPWVIVLATTGAILILGLSITVFFLLSKLTASSTMPVKEMSKSTTTSSPAMSSAEGSPVKDATNAPLRNAPLMHNAAPVAPSPSERMNSRTPTKAVQVNLPRRVNSTQRKQTASKHVQNAMKGVMAIPRNSSTKAPRVIDTDFTQRLKNMRTQ